MYLKNDMKAKFTFLRDLDAAVGFTGTMMTQSFEGSTTIVPQVQLSDFFTLFSDPTVKSMYRYLQVGTVAAYQHAAMIRLHYRIADALDECIEKLEATSVPSSIDDATERALINSTSPLRSKPKVKASRRASFDVAKTISWAVLNANVPPHLRRQSSCGTNNNMPDIISTALNERLTESDSTSLSDGSVG